MVFGRDGGESLRVGELEVEGQFVAYSTDEKGLLMASLVGGTRLTSPHVCLAPEKAKYFGNVTKIDYEGRTHGEGVYFGHWSQWGLVGGKWSILVRSVADPASAVIGELRK